MCRRHHEELQHDLDDQVAPAQVLPTCRWRRRGEYGPSLSTAMTNPLYPRAAGEAWRELLVGCGGAMRRWGGSGAVAARDGGTRGGGAGRQHGGWAAHAGRYGGDGGRPRTEGGSRG